MIRSELIERLSARHALTARDADKIVSAVLDAIASALIIGRRVELRGFGSFSVKLRPSRSGRNPRTGATVLIAEKRHAHFRASKEMRGRLGRP
jgi:integration host factor subunit beta